MHTTQLLFVVHVPDVPSHIYQVNLCCHSSSFGFNFVGLVLKNTLPNLMVSIFNLFFSFSAFFILPDVCECPLN